METMNIIRGITKFISRLIGTAYGILVAAILFFRAFTQAAPTTEDISLFTVLGVVVASFFLIDYVINTLRIALKKQLAKINEI